MAGAPNYKVYNAERKYMAACKEVEAAACLVGLYGNGSTIRYGHSWIVWQEGAEVISASESYDEVAATVARRIREANLARFERQYGLDRAKWPSYAQEYAEGK